MDKEMEGIIKSFKEALDAIGKMKIPHDQYLKNIPAYKKIIDDSPNKFLSFHLKNSIKDEQYEIAEYIKQTAIERNFELEI